MKSLLHNILLLSLLAFAHSTLVAEPTIRVAYPPAGSTLGATTKTYVIGSVTPADTPIIVNAQTVTPWRTGSFIFMADVTPGANTLLLRTGQTKHRHTFRVPLSTPAVDPNRIRVVSPLQPLGIYTGEIVRLECRAPTGHTLFACLGERTIALTPTTDNAALYHATTTFPTPAENVPVTFYAEGLADAPAAEITVRTRWPTQRVTGPLFETRARALPGDGTTIAFLPAEPELTLQGAGYIGNQTRLWIDSQMCFVASTYLEPLPDTPPPPRSKAVPDITAGFGPHPPKGRTPAEVLIVLDPGHGGHESGALGPSGLTEKEINLIYANAMRDVLKKAGFRVIMTRESDVYVNLYERARIAWHAKADAFISVHHNATATHTDPRKVRHVSTYAWNAIGLQLAHALHPPIAAVTPIPDRGVMTAAFAVCRNPAIPSCLLELDFINLPQGEEDIQQPTQQERVAQALLTGLLNWLKGDE